MGMLYYLSIVIAARNDNYGGDFISRLQKCITWNTRLLEKYKVKTEFIIVNWNPIEENKTIEEQIEWIDNRRYVKYRIITVSQEIHEKYIDDNIRKTVPLFEYLAKNAGIKRASGEFVLTLNPDILISETIIKDLAKRKLNKSVFYRANRFDFINNDITQKTKIWLKGFSYPYQKNLFQLKIKNQIRCWWRKNSVKCTDLFNYLSWKVYYHHAEYKYHCNVSGDFLLMHSSAWSKLKGNPENTFLALHTDAMMVIMAATSGLKEKVFKSPIYHQEHTRRFNATEKGNEEYRKAYLLFQEEAQKMIQQEKATIYNDKKWGLANFDLLEEIF